LDDDGPTATNILHHFDRLTAHQRWHSLLLLLLVAVTARRRLFSRRRGRTAAANANATASHFWL
jgi:uncharacterized membrane protein affecting hemolysin expression